MLARYYDEIVERKKTGQDIETQLDKIDKIVDALYDKK